MAEALRFGFLGASRIGRRALAPAVLLAGHRLHAVAARDPARAGEFAAEFAAPRAYGSYAELIADPDIDAVYIALTNEQHLPWTRAALRAGKPVLCEKPLALSEAEVATMQAESERSGGVVMEAFCHIFHPQFARLRALLADGAIGRLLGLQASFTSRMPAEDFRWQPALGGGALYDLGTYCVSLLRLLAGDPERVSAVQTTRSGVDATLAGQLHFPGGIAGQFLCSFEGALAQHLLLRGSDGEITLDWPISTKGRPTHLAHDGIVEEFPATDPYVAMVANFAAAVQSGAPLLFDLAQSRAQAAVLDALFAAAAAGTCITPPPRA